MALPDPLFILSDWATSGTATKPSSARIASGWSAGEKPTDAHVNYLFQQAFRQLSEMGARRFASLDDASVGLTDAATNLPIYTTCILDERDTDQRPGAVHTSVAGAANVGAVVCTGESIIVIEGVAAAATFKEYTRGLALIQTFAPSHAMAAPYAIATNGRHVVAAYMDGLGAFWVECWLRSSGASLWTYDHGNGITDICLDGTRVYVVGSAGVGAHEARALNLTTGALVWAYAHGATLYKCATDGSRCYIAGLAAPAGSLSHVRALTAEAGEDAANEGGTAADTSGRAWDGGITLNDYTNAGGMATDGRHLWVTMLNGSNYLQIMECSYGTILTTPMTAALPSTPSGIALDHAFVLVAFAGQISAFDKVTLARAWTRVHAVGNVYSVATDGCAVFQGAQTGGGGLTLTRIYRGNRAGVWRRVNPTDNYLPYRQILIPQEG
jgi:hypothetical protein